MLGLQFLRVMLPCRTKKSTFFFQSSMQHTFYDARSHMTEVGRWSKHDTNTQTKGLIFALNLQNYNVFLKNKFIVNQTKKLQKCGKRWYYQGVQHNILPMQH